MPFLDLSLHNAHPAAGEVSLIKKGLTELMASLMGKRGDLTVVAVKTAPAEEISIGAEPVAPGSWGGRLLVYVTAGTNSREQKAEFLQAAYDLLARVLSAPASPFYIVVHEIEGTAWGYDGISQTARAATATHARV